MPKQSIKTILFTHYGDNWIRGSERCLLDLLTHLDKRQFRPIVWCNSDLMYNAVKELGITAYQSPFSLILGWQKPKFSINTYIKLIRTGIKLVKQYNVSIIHANSGAPCQWLNLVARCCNVPVIAHLHARYPLRDRLTLGLHHVNKAVGVSKPIIQQLHNDGIAEQDLTVISNGVDIERLQNQPAFSLRKKLKLTQQDFVIVSIGSLIHRKGFDTLIAAVAALKTLSVPAKLIIIGEGEEKETLREFIDHKNLNRDVFLLGEQTNVCGLLKDDINIVASAAREEVFGLVFAEAAIAGLASIAPNVGGIPEVIKNNETGLLFERQNRRQLILALLRCYQKPELCQQLGKQAELHVNQHFSIKRNVERFQQLYSQQIVDSQTSKTGWLTHLRLIPLLKSCSQIASLYLKPKMRGLL